MSMAQRGVEHADVVRPFVRDSKRRLTWRRVEVLESALRSKVVNRWRAQDRSFPRAGATSQSSAVVVPGGEPQRNRVPTSGRRRANVAVPVGRAIVVDEIAQGASEATAGVGLHVEGRSQLPTRGRCLAASR